MKRAALLIAALILAFSFIGCRDITPDLHDIYEITIDLTPIVQFTSDFEAKYYGGSIDGKMKLTLKTDVYGKLESLPTPKWGEWFFECNEVDEWGYPHETQARCEYLECDKFKWTFELDANGPGFIGWYTSGGTPVTTWTVFRADTRIFAKWLQDDGPPAQGSVAAQLADLRNAPGVPNARTITVNKDEKLKPQELSFGGVGIVITLKGIKPEETFYCWDGEDCQHENHLYTRDNYTNLSLHIPGAMFTVKKGVTLIIEDVDIYGFHRNNTSLINIEDGGKVILRQNSMLAFNSVDSHLYGGAITVQKGGELVMEDGYFYQNFSRHPRFRLNDIMGGGAVWVRGGSFTMNGGLMFENVSLGGGGAVRVSHGGTFIMNDGFLLENAAFFGGAVYVSGMEDIGASTSTFIMNDGEIEENFSPLWGGAVSVATHGRFILNGGWIAFNESGGGGAFDNDGGHIFIRDGIIFANSALGGLGGAISNFWNIEVSGGIMFGNEATFGGGILNFSTYVMLFGHVWGNIGNGGPAGGIFNIGHFEMHGGTINSNMSTSQGGGIVHGFSSNPYVGKFIITNGQIWNNRDRSGYHIDGLPGEYGNIRRSNPNRESFTLARPGYFSITEEGLPAGWQSVPGGAPVYENIDPNEEGAAPTDWQTIYWFVPPEPVPTADNDYMTWIHYTEGRPRIEINTPFNPSSVPLITYDLSYPAIAGSGATIRPAHGGTWFPSTLATRHVINGYLWEVTNGVLEAFTIRGSVEADWDVPPATGWWGGWDELEVTDPESWPWEDMAGPLPNMPPMMLRSRAQLSSQAQLQSIMDHPKFREKLQKRPELMQYIVNRKIEPSLWPVMPLEKQLENRTNKIMLERLEKRFDEIIEPFLNRVDGW